MNIKNLILLCFLIFQIKSTAQTQKYAIACDSFTINSKVRSEAASIRRIFEKIISMKEFPFTFVEKDQDKINNIFTLLKNEKISKENIGKKQPDIDFLGLDYLVSGDITSSDNIDSKTYKINIQFTSVSGQKVRQYLNLYFSVTKEDLQFDVIDERLPPLFLKAIHSFVDNYFENTQKPLKLNQKPEIIERLERLDSINNNLLNENKRINNVLDYSYVARMNISGELYDNLHRSLPYKSDDLVRLMSPVFRDTMILYGNEPMRTEILQFDSTAEKAIDIVIQKHPKFPFGYLIKSKILYERKDSNYVIYAEKAREIFEITTAITNHSPEHDKALAVLKELLGK